MTPDAIKALLGPFHKNRVLVDLADMWAQIGVDVLGRMRASGKVRILSPVPMPGGLE